MEEIDNEIVCDEFEDLIYVGLIMKEDGWYKMYSDGNKHYSFEKYEK